MTAIKRCRDGLYRGCDFMGCDDVNVQVVVHGRQVAPCRLHGPPVPPEMLGSGREVQP